MYISAEYDDACASVQNFSINILSFESICVSELMLLVQHLVLCSGTALSVYSGVYFLTGEWGKLNEYRSSS